jgi:predicted amidohydrolase YtcJ
VNAHGEPTGILSGALQPIYNADPLYQMVARVAPVPTYDDIRDGIAALAPKFAAGGTTSLLEAHLTDPEELRAYAELLADGRLPLRIFYTFEIDAGRPLAEIEQTLRTLRFAANGGFGTPRLKVVGVSIGLDGPYWHGAACHDRPYLGPFGTMVDPATLIAPDRYRAIVELAARMNFRVHAEAAGRGSIALALATFAAIDSVTPIAHKRWVLEHCEFPTPAQIALCKRLGVAPTTSSNFLWGKGEEVYRRRLGEETAAVAIPLRDWLDAGVPVAQSTDWGPHEAMFTLWQSLARQAGLSGETIGPGQRITREEAIRLYTSNAAWALAMEHELGSLEAGKRADLIVLAGDPLACPQDDLREMAVDLTMLDGAIVATAH